jgi:hypothetical protein
MISLPSPERDLAHRLLSRETVEREVPGEVAAAGERVLRRLRDHLAQWFGAEGVDGLLGRAMDRAYSAHPAPGTARPANGESALDAFVRRARAQPPNEAAEATVGMLTAFIALLGRMVGSDMAERLVEQSWPDEARLKDQRPRHE